MKQTLETGLEQMDTIVTDLLEQVQEMREMLSSVQISLVQLALSNAKHQAQETRLTLVDGPKKPNSSQSITRRQEDLTKAKSYPLY